MSYADELEKTVQGDFAELYTFAIAGEIWRYTSYQKDIVFGGDTFLAANIKRSEWSNESELSPQKVKITVPLEEFISQFVANYPVLRVNLDIVRWFVDDVAAYFLLFSGELGSIVITKNGAELTYESASLLYTAKIPRVTHQAACNNALFDSVCALDEFVYRVSLAGVTVSGTSITHATIGTFPNDYFQWGYVKTTNEDYRLITGHTGTTITIQSEFSDTTLKTGDNLTAWPGCDKARATCSGKFSNSDNFVGFPWIPSHNPVIYGVETEIVP